jgi:hypothetical protein
MASTVAGSINGGFFLSPPESAADLMAGVQAAVTTLDATLLTACSGDRLEIDGGRYETLMI